MSLPHSSGLRSMNSRRSSLASSRSRSTTSTPRWSIRSSPFPSWKFSDSPTTTLAMPNWTICSTAFYDSRPLPACIQMAKVAGLFSGGLVVDGSGGLASAHRRVVDEFIEVVLDDLAGDMGDVERNVLGVALRSEVETRLAPELFGSIPVATVL